MNNMSVPNIEAQPLASSNIEHHVLCVDDDRYFLKSLEFFLPDEINKRRLPNLWYRFHFLENPKASLELLRELHNSGETVAMIIADQMMPHMKGTEFLLEARKITNDPIRVLMTGYAGMESAITAINEQLLEKYLTKPIEDEHDFVVSIHHLLHKFQMQKRLEVVNRQLQQEIAEHKLVNEALRISEENLKRAQEVAQIGSWHLSVQAKRMFCSDETRRIFGFDTSSSVINFENFLSAVHPDDQVYVSDKWTAAMNNKGAYDLEHRIVVGGAVKWIRQKAKIEFDPTGQPVSGIGVVHDITVYKKMEQESFKIAKLKSMEIFSGGIAHDFNNLLTIIICNLDYITARSEQDSQFRDHVKNIKSACRRSKDLIRQLLDFSQTGSPTRSTVSVAELLRETVEFSLTGTAVKCEFAIPDNLSYIDVDYSQMSQVIQNLVINAVQAMPGRGVIKINAENITISSDKSLPLVPGDYVKITVTDQGCGIEPEQLDKIFDPYFTTKEEGNGLGLSIIYSIVKKHDGYIRVDSKLDVGTTFNIYLPTYHPGGTSK